VEIIKKLDKGENLLIWLKSMALDVLRYTTSGKIEKIECFVTNIDSGPSDRQTLNIELMDKNSQ
jgi:hypothetical protein